MRTIIVDDELWALDQFQDEAKRIPEIEIVGKFRNPLEALEFASNNTVDFALLDIEMFEMNGLELGKRLREINPTIIIIFVTSYSQYVKEAFLSVKADYFIQKPYNYEDIRDAFERAKLLSLRQRRRVRFNVYGHFDMFVDNKVVKFSNAKAKELLALCVDHAGGTVTMDEAIDKLWENRLYDNNVKRLYRKAIIYLNALCMDHNAVDVFESGRAVCHINKNAVECEYFDFLSNPSKFSFSDDYMFDYTWAEETKAKILFDMMEKA